MTRMFAAVLLAFVPAAGYAQDPTQVQKLFQAGQYQQVVESAGADAPPAVLYTVAQSHQKLGATDQAMEVYGRLASRPEGDPWRSIAIAAQRLLEEQPQAAAEAAQQAVAAGGNLAEAHYQLGLVQAKQQNWQGAAASFDRAAEIDPSLAYAYYYSGLMHYRANRLDRMAIQFEYFLKLAPDAPERPEVQQIMRTVRGR